MSQSRAVTKPTAANPILSPDTDDLIIRAFDDMSLSHWVGTRAQLDAEGITNDKTPWPTGRSTAYWTDGGWSFWMKRTRRPGTKAAASDDYWLVGRRKVGDTPAHASVRLARRRLQDAEFAATDIGRAQWNDEFSRLLKSLEDKAYQRFRAAAGLPQ